MTDPEHIQFDHSQSDRASAREKLISAFTTSPYNPTLIEEIARLSMDLQEPVEAGRWYFCCDSQDSQSAELINLFLSTHGSDPQQLLEQIPPAILKLPPTSLPDTVRKRLFSVCQSAVGTESESTTPVPQPRPRASVFDWIFRAILFIVGGLLVAIFLKAALIVGILYLIDWLFGR